MNNNLGSYGSYTYRLSILVPTYNEGSIIKGALEEIQNAIGKDLAKESEILIVDDGTDNLPQVVNEVSQNLIFANVQVLRSSPPVGKGASLARGFDVAMGKTVGFLDVDLSTHPSYILEALSKIESGESEVFIASRKAVGSDIKREQFFIKDILGHMLGVIARSILFFGMRKFKDTQCGFKFYHNKDAKILYQNLVAPDGLNDLEVLLRANLMDLNVHEQGVKWVDIRESKRSLRRILFGEIKAILKIVYTYKLFASTQRKILVQKQELI